MLKRTHVGERVAVYLLLVALCSPPAARLDAQPRTTFDVNTAISCFRGDKSVAGVYEKCALDAPRVPHVLMNQARFSRGVVERVFAALTDVALHETDRRVRIAAVVTIGSAGGRNLPGSEPVSAVPFLETVYDNGDRTAITAVLRVLPWQHDREGAVALLRRMVEEAEPIMTRGDESPTWWSAAYALHKFGPEGMAALIELDGSDAFRSSPARQLVAALVAQGPPPPPG